MNEEKKRGRPRKVTQEEDRKKDLLPKGDLKFAQILKRYLDEARWTNREFMSAIGLADAQVYRWISGESIPRKATVNRIGIQLAMRLDELYGEQPNDPYPFMDAIDGLLNQLLEAAGYASSIKGRSGNDCWSRIEKNRSWTLGYTDVPDWSVSNKNSGEPTGKAIEYALKIGKLLGLKTYWEYLKFEEMPTAIRERQVDGIAPFMVVLPGRLFDYRFSKKCGKDKFTLIAITENRLINGANNIKDLSIDNVELVFVKGELGDWGRRLLPNYRCKDFSETIKAIAYIDGIVKRQESVIPIFLVDNITGTNLIEQVEDLNLSIISVDEFEFLSSYNAFVFHPDEKRLIEAVDLTIELIPSISMSIKSEREP